MESCDGVNTLHTQAQVVHRNDTLLSHAVFSMRMRQYLFETLEGLFSLGLCGTALSIHVLQSGILSIQLLNMHLPFFF